MNQSKLNYFEEIESSSSPLAYSNTKVSIALNKLAVKKQQQTLPLHTWPGKPKVGRALHESLRPFVEVE